MLLIAAIANIWNFVSARAAPGKGAALSGLARQGAAQMRTGYLIAPAKRADLASLAEIERIAAGRFEGRGLPEAALSETTPLAEYLEACVEGRLWVASAPDGTIVGFALCEWLGDEPHLQEIDVHPDHGRRGVGAALVQSACEWARERGHRRLTLTTFRAIPWNEPFYRALGFEELPRRDWSVALRERIAEEAGAG